MSEVHGSPRAEPGIGRRLRQARETRGLSLRRVEEITKIRARYLGELERENFDVLPTVYVLGSLKTYADFLGLDGSALARELKESLEPNEPEAAVAADPGETDDEEEATPAVSIGFDHLFVGMGVVIVSVLALMTLVSAVARYEEPKVSQMNEPSVQNVPPEMALAGNVDPEPRDPEPRAAEEDGKKKEQPKPDEREKPEPPKEDEGGAEEERPEEASSPTSLFGDVEFVPMSPSRGASSSSASASSSPAPPASAPATSAPSSTPSASASPASAPPASASPASTPSAFASPPSASPSPSSASPAGASATPDPPSPAAISSPAASAQSAAQAQASVRPARPVETADAGSGPVAGPTRGGGASRGSVGVFSPQDVADAGRIRAGVDATLEGSIPGR